MPPRDNYTHSWICRLLITDARSRAAAADAAATQTTNARRPTGGVAIDANETLASLSGVAKPRAMCFHSADDNRLEVAKRVNVAPITGRAVDFDDDRPHQRLV